MAPATVDRFSACCAERRHLTVMFCDLMESTELLQKLDPGALRALMRAYTRCCGAVIEKCDGHVAPYLGDGLMTSFDRLRTHEGDAERVIRAASAIADGVKKMWRDPNRSSSAKPVRMTPR